MTPCTAGRYAESSGSVKCTEVSIGWQTVNCTTTTIAPLHRRSYYSHRHYPHNNH